jgi:hypothetical protein
MRAARLARGCAAALLGLALPARALVVDGDPEAALREPAPGSPVASVAKRGGTTGVYLGGGWVITAGHVGAGEIALGGVSYPPVQGSWKPLRGQSPAPPDLGVFRVDPAPGLPPLEIARRGPGVGEALLLVACGLGRGERIEWQGRPGFRWEPVNVRRWGRNRVAATGLEIPGSGVSTAAFATLFTPGDPEEAQAALGDSGGGAFVLRGGSWQLAGILFAVENHPGQPPQTSLEGNASYAADLSRYRDEIEALTGRRDAAAPPIR